MLYSYGSFLSKITLSLSCIVVPVPYVSINPSKKKEAQVVSKPFFNDLICIKILLDKKEHDYGFQIKRFKRESLACSYA